MVGMLEENKDGFQMNPWMHVSYKVIRKDLPIYNISEDIDEIREFSKYGHNFLISNTSKVWQFEGKVRH